jgi:hypothetical protein
MALSADPSQLGNAQPEAIIQWLRDSKVEECDRKTSFGAVVARVPRVEAGLRKCSPDGGETS